jgi:hypothetical protein
MSKRSIDQISISDDDKVRVEAVKKRIVAEVGTHLSTIREQRLVLTQRLKETSELLAASRSNAIASGQFKTLVESCKEVRDALFPVHELPYATINRNSTRSDAIRRGQKLEDLAKNGPNKKEAAAAIKFTERDAVLTKALAEHRDGRSAVAQMLAEATPIDPSTQEECDAFNREIKELERQMEYVQVWEARYARLSLDYGTLKKHDFKPV